MLDLNLRRSFLCTSVCWSLLLPTVALAECHEMTAYPKVSDTRFAADPPPPTPTLTWGTSVPAPLVIKVRRVVGMGRASDLHDHFLNNWEQLHQNGVVSQYAWLEVTLDQMEGAPSQWGLPATMDVYLNGDVVGSITQRNGDLIVNGVTNPATGSCLRIETSKIRFAQRVPGGVPIPGENQIWFRLRDTGGWGMEEEILPGFVTGHVGTLSFEAMAPIVLVHGYNSGPWAWDLPNPGGAPIFNGPGGCPSDPSQDEFGAGFVGPLLDARVPFDCSLRILPQSTTPEGADQIRLRLGPILSSFGACDLDPQPGGTAKTACHVNFITHSKGGLWTRQFIKNLGSQSWVGIDSFTTLDSPHHGSAIADMAHLARLGPAHVIGSLQTDAGSWAYNSWLGNIPGFANAWGEAVEDLTVARAERFNGTQREMPPEFRLYNLNGDAMPVLRTCYYSISADADQNNSGNIGHSEGLPYSAILPLAAGTLLADASYQFIKNVMSVELDRDVPAVGIAGTRRLFVHEVPNPTPQLNDIIVSMNSARYPSFHEVFARTGSNGRNHNKVKDGVAASIILPKIPMTGGSRRRCF